MNNTEFEYRVIMPKNLDDRDLHQLMEVEKAAFPKNSYSIQQMKGTVEYEGCATFVVEDGDKIIGFVIIGYDIEGQEELLFVDFAVMPEYQSKGIGTDLLYLAFSSYVAPDNTPVVLTVKEDNIRAIKYYKNLGFENDNNFIVSEKAEDDIVMSISYKSLLTNIVGRIKYQAFMKMLKEELNKTNSPDTIPNTKKRK